MQPFRGQFIAANSLSKIPSNFVRTEIEGLSIYHHRDLPIAVDGQAALIGLVFDPTNPPFGIGDVLADVRRRSGSGRTNHLAGRWVLIDGNIVLHDACGTMPLTYVTREGQTVVASSSALLAYCLEDLQRDVRFDSGAWNVKRRKAHSGLAFPATFTEYIGVRALLPNHYLDRDTGKAARYYPATRLPQRSAEELAPQIAEMLSRIVRAVSLRGPCGMSLTAGYDSRALAAAVSTIDGMSEKTTFFTFQDQFGCPAGHRDIATGRKIAEVVGGGHAKIIADASSATVAADTMLAPRFDAWVKASAELAGRTILTGWCSEVGRAFIRWHGSDDPTAEQIADCHTARSLRFALPEFEQWLSDARRIRAEHSIPIMDLFYWEYRGHRWVGSSLNILNTGADWVSVYSCRDLLNLMLSVQESERGGKRQELYRKIILCLKPELLDVPFNPEPLRTRIVRSVNSSAKALTVRLTRKIGVYEALKRARGAFR